MRVVIPVPLAREVTVGGFELSQEQVGRFAQTCDGSALTGLLEGADPIDGDLAQPRAKGTIAPSFKRRHLSEEDNKDLLSKVVYLVSDAGDARQPGVDQRPV